MEHKVSEFKKNTKEIVGKKKMGEVPMPINAFDYRLNLIILGLTSLITDIANKTFYNLLGFLKTLGWCKLFIIYSTLLLEQVYPYKKNIILLWALVALL